MEPDWTYEELIDLLIEDRKASWQEYGKTMLARGFAREFPVKIVIEERPDLPRQMPTYDDAMTIGHRYWRFDESGIEEIDRAAYQELMARFAEDLSQRDACSFSRMNFRLEEDLQYVVLYNWQSDPAGGHVLITRNRVGRGNNGKLAMERVETLARS